MRRMARKSMLVKNAFIKGVRDARIGRIDAHPEIQKRLAEYSELEKFNHGNETPSPRMLQLLKEIANIREAYITAMEMATLEPDKDYFDLLSEFTGEDKEELRRQMDPQARPKKQKRVKTITRAQQVELKRAEEIKRRQETYKAEKAELFFERAKILGTTTLVIASLAAVAWMENLSTEQYNEIFGRAKPKNQHTRFVEGLNPNNGTYTQNDGTTVTYTVPQSGYELDRE